MAALFGNTAQRHGGKKNLLEFKAGKMFLQGKMCHADKRKGLVFIHQTEDSLMHFCWKDRTTGKVEEVSAAANTNFQITIIKHCWAVVYNYSVVEVKSHESPSSF